MSPVRSASGMNSSGGTRPWVGVLPAHQRLHPQDLAAVGVDLGLVVQDKLLLLDGPAQLAEQGQPTGAVLVQRGVEQHEPGVGLFGRVHGDVGALQQLVGVGGVVGIQGHADAGFHVQAQPLECERLLEGGLQLVGDGHGTLAGGDLGQQHGELVAAEPGDGVDLAQRAAQPLADLNQELVAVVVAEGVVDLLEPVQVEQQQRSRDQFPVGLADCLAGAVV